MDTNCNRLQRAQNSALRIAIGCLEMGDVAEMHQVARELPVQQHNELISKQFALACHLPQHPCHQLSHRPPDDRPNRRRSLNCRFRPNIQQYLAEEPLNITSYKSAKSSIHQDAVRTAIESSSSKLLNGRLHPLQQPNRHFQGRQEQYRHNSAPVTAVSLVSTWIESTWQRATIATTVVIRPMTPTTYSTTLRSRPHWQ